MAEGKKERISNNMDISLVEEVKEKAMRSVYNMNNVIRMSFIEAQFIKKEMMNALVAMDEMQASTNFNMNLAAIGPFALLSWTTQQLSSFIFYTTFKWGKSRTGMCRFWIPKVEIQNCLCNTFFSERNGYYFLCLTLVFGSCVLYPVSVSNFLYQKRTDRSQCP